MIKPYFTKYLNTYMLGLNKILLSYESIQSVYTFHILDEYKNRQKDLRSDLLETWAIWIYIICLLILTPQSKQQTIYFLINVCNYFALSVKSGKSQGLQMWAQDLFLDVLSETDIYITFASYSNKKFVS